MGRVLLSKTGHIFDMNHQAEVLLSHQDKKPKGKLFTDYLTQETIPVFDGFLNRVFSTNQNELCEVSLANVDTQFCGYVCLFAHAIAFGELCQMTITFVNNNKRIPSLLDRNIGQFKLNMLAKTSWRSVKHGQIFGYKNSDHDWNFEIFLQHVVPEDRDRIAKVYQQSISLKEEFSFEYRIRRKDNGSMRWLWSVASPVLDSNGTCVMLQGIVQDVTDLKRFEIELKDSEERYYNLLFGLDIGFLIQGSNSEILVSNPSALRLLGVTLDQLKGRTSFDPSWNVIHEDGTDFPGSTRPVQVSIATKKPVLNAIMGVYRPVTNDRVWLSANAEPRLNLDGSVKDVICTFKDITALLKRK
jgi:PAS domain S-box-containing protein